MSWPLLILAAWAALNALLAAWMLLAYLVIDPRARRRRARAERLAFESEVDGYLRRRPR